VLLSLLINSGKLYAQTHTFGIHAAGKEIGKITASLTEHENKQSYEIVSDVNFKVLWRKYNRTTSNLAIYENEELTASFSGVYMNEDLEDSSTLYMGQDKYLCFRYPNERFEIKKEPVHFTTAKLYFKEPIGVDQIYSERYLDYGSIEHIENHQYKLTLPNGKVNYYTYTDEVLVEVLVDRTWFDLEFRKK